ncbi:MAG: GSCFA domain-containing protein [Aquimarina sp.]|nr:GSCFA domain-containing protein [Aquimarina sp.]
MELQTRVDIKKGEPLIDYHSNLILLGSCFAENIGDKLSYYKFRSSVNPFGILFHAKAIETFLFMATQQEEYAEEDIFFYNEQWHSFDAHSSLSSPDKLELLFNLNNGLINAYQRLKSATHIIITLGTSWVYRLKQLDMIVANCHKVPQKEFDKSLLSVDDNLKSIETSVALLKSVNPMVKIIFAVSPVRHIKDGSVENTVSKSNLLSAVYNITKSHEDLDYFPSYEIMMDELRDYRFYKEDMIHPSSLAVDYIWQKFKDSWVSEASEQMMKNIEDIQKGMAHKPFNPDSEAHKSFLQKLEVKKQDISENYPHIRF